VTAELVSSLDFSLSSVQMCAQQIQLNVFDQWVFTLTVTKLWLMLSVDIFNHLVFLGIYWEHFIVYSFSCVFLNGSLLACVDVAEKAASVHDSCLDR
jgi:hypothetical protein